MDAFFVFPALAQPLALGSLLLALGMVITFAADAQVRNYKEGRVDRRRGIWNILIDLFGILLVLLAATGSGLVVSSYVRQFTGRTVDSTMPGNGLLIGNLAGLLAGMAAGVLIGFLAQILWEKIAKLLLPRKSELERD